VACGSRGGAGCGRPGGDAGADAVEEVGDAWVVEGAGAVHGVEGDRREVGDAAGDQTGGGVEYSTPPLRLLNPAARPPVAPRHLRDARSTTVRVVALKARRS
jgi:hypothetical protein